MTGSADHPPSVLQVVAYYPPDRIGGVGETVRLIHDELLARGVDAEVLTSGTTRESGVARIGRSPAGFAIRSWAVVRRAREFDIVHFHHGEAILLMAALRLLSKRPLIVLTLQVDVRRLITHGRRTLGAGTIGNRVLGWLRVFMDWAALKLADGVTVVSAAVAEEIEDLVPAERIRLVQNGVRSRPRTDLHSRNSNEILYVGTHGIRKRTDRLADILHHVQQRVPDATLRIVGFGVGDDHRLDQAIARHGLADSISFEGPVRPSEVFGFYERATAVVVPSVYEGMTLVLLEAMSTGTPCVATAVSGHPEVLEDGRNGFLFPADDAVAAAGALVELLRHGSLWDSVSWAAWRTVEQKFSVGRQVDEYMGVYRGLAAGRPFGAGSTGDLE